jgi:sugar O-acyltransferase (sialic acid O-acetyltransferase NeuD family)
VRLLVVGAGGHAKVVIDTARAAGWDIGGVVGVEGDAPEILGHCVVLTPEDVDADAFIVAIGDNHVRARTYERYLQAGMTPATVVHPSAVIGSGVEIGGGSLVVAGAIVNVDAHIGADAILNTGCMIDHDCVIGDHSLIGPGATLCGGVKIGDGALLGAGVNAIPLARVGEWSQVGAGATVIGAIPSATVAVGVPARPIHGIEE